MFLILIVFLAWVLHKLIRDTFESDGKIGKARLCFKLKKYRYLKKTKKNRATKIK